MRNRQHQVGMSIRHSSSGRALRQKQRSRKIARPSKNFYESIKRHRR